METNSENFFYHTVQLPDGRTFEGEWDLRSGIDDYLGGVNFAGKRVLDVGTANGFLTFEMEKKGAAEVVSFDLDPEQEWDVVPYAGFDHAKWIRGRKEHIRKINNAYHYCHKAFGSKAKLIHGTVYQLPKEIGQVDISVLGSILLHLRDPWSAIKNVLALTRETVIITEKLPRRYLPLKYIRKLDRAWITFLPDARKREPVDGWWILTPAAITKMIGVLGFDKTELHFHRAPLEGRMQQLFTVVGHRTVPLSSETKGN